MFYAFGAAEGLLLDHTHPHWQQQYFTEKFTLERYFAWGKRNCEQIRSRFRLNRQQTGW